MNGDLVWGGNCIYIYRRANSFRPNTNKSVILMQSKNLKREVTIKDIALLFGFRYLNVAPRFVFMITLKKKRYCSVQFSWSAKLTWEEIKLAIEQRVTNSTIVIKIWKFVFCRSAYNYLVSCTVITENSKEYSEVFAEWSAHKSFILYAG